MAEDAVEKPTIRPEQYDAIGFLFASGWTFKKIAAHYGVSFREVRDLFFQVIFPLVRADPSRSVEAEMIRIDRLEEFVVSRLTGAGLEFSDDQLADWGIDLALVKRAEMESATKAVANYLRIRQWCIEERSKLSGHYAAKKLRIDDDEFRVAGMSVSQVNAIVLKRLKEKLDQQDNYNTYMVGKGVLLESRDLGDAAHANGRVPSPPTGKATGGPASGSDAGRGQSASGPTVHDKSSPPGRDGTNRPGPASSDSQGDVPGDP